MDYAYHVGKNEVKFSYLLEAHFLATGVLRICE